MPRQLRLEYAGAIYHVMNRGDRREAIFRDEEDRERFLYTLAQACRKTEWQVHAWCLLGNHFHLVVETPQPNLVADMKWLLGVYTKRFIFDTNSAALSLPDATRPCTWRAAAAAYLGTVCDYVHLNPARAKLLKAGAVGELSVEQLRPIPQERQPTAMLAASGPVAWRKGSPPG